MAEFDEKNLLFLKLFKQRLARLNNWRKNGYHTDTLLSVDNDNCNSNLSPRIEAHSFVLSAISDYFCSHFRHTPPHDQSLDKPLHRFYVHLPGFSAAALQAFIEFAYTGQLNLVTDDTVVKFGDINNDELATSVMLGTDGLLALSAYLMCEEALCLCRNWTYEQLLMRLSVEDVAPSLVRSVLCYAHSQADAFLFDIGVDVACSLPYRFIDALTALPEDVFFEVCLSGRPLFSLVVNDAKELASVTKHDYDANCRGEVAPASNQTGEKQPHRRLLFGRQYLAELLVLFDAYQAARKRQEFAQTALLNAAEHSKTFRTQLEKAFASNHPVSRFYCGFKGVPILVYPPICSINMEAPGAKKLCTFDGFPPWDFVISSIRVIYINISAGKTTAVAGIDIEYRNIWTGQKSWFLCGYDQINNQGLITNETLILAEGEFITKVHYIRQVFYNKLTFTTTQSCHSDSFDRSSMTVAPYDLDSLRWRTCSAMRERVGDTEMAQMSLGSEARFANIGDGCYLPLGLHGFRYEQRQDRLSGVDAAFGLFYAFRCQPAHTLLTTTRTPSAAIAATTVVSTNDASSMTKSKQIFDVECMPLVDLNRFTNIKYDA